MAVLSELINSHPNFHGLVLQQKWRVSDPIKKWSKMVKNRFLYL